MTFNIKAVIFAFVVASVLGFHYYDKSKAVEKAKEEISLQLREEHQRELLESIQRSEKAQTAILQQHAKNIKTRDDKIKLVIDRLNDALVRLHDRPARSEQHPNNTGNPISCTGRELSREDGEFLTREAAAAEKLIAERDYYYEQYESVRIQLNKLKKETNE